MRCAIVQDYVVTEVRELTEEEIQSIATRAQAVVQIDGMSPEPGVGWVMSGGNLLPPLGTDQVELICLSVYDPVMKFVNRFTRRFIGENIAWGITQQGKTRAVGELLKDVDFWIHKGSLYETIQEVEKVKVKIQNDPDLAASVAPFVTVTRLDAHKLEIYRFLGLA